MQLRHTVLAALWAALALLAWEAWGEASFRYFTANYIDLQNWLLPLTLNNFTQNIHLLLLGGYWLSAQIRIIAAGRTEIHPQISPQPAKGEMRLE